jgi:hypothetical protein
MRMSFRIPSGLPPALADVYRGLSQSAQGNFRIAPSHRHRSVEANVGLMSQCVSHKFLFQLYRLVSRNDAESSSTCCPVLCRAVSSRATFECAVETA